jgi:hypothetical protein
VTFTLFKYKEEFSFPFVRKQALVVAVSISNALTGGLKCCVRAGRDAWTEVGSRYSDYEAVFRSRTTNCSSNVSLEEISRSNAIVQLKKLTIGCIPLAISSFIRLL